VLFRSSSVVLSWDANGAPDGYTVLFNRKIVQENVTGTTFTHENVPAGEHTYWVFATKGDCMSYIAETSVMVCDEDPKNLTAQQVATSVVLTWEADYTGSYSFTVFLNGEILAENITTKTYTHTNVPGGEHTYGLLAVIGECTFNIVETSIEICAKPTNFTAQVESNIVGLTWDDTYGSYAIYFNGEPLVENLTISSYTHEDVPLGEHTYGIVAVGMNCISEIVETTVNILGIDEFNSPFKIYPNPANDYLFVEGAEIESISIYNSFGQLVKNVATASDVVKINTQDMSAGLYLLQIKTKSGMTRTEKIVIKN
jgi:hypothetical protein